MVVDATKKGLQKILGPAISQLGRDTILFALVGRIPAGELGEHSP